MFLVLLFAIGVFAQSSHYLFGPSFGIRTYPGNNAIIESFETTLLPGAPTDPPQSRLAIWPGLDTSNGDLIQPIVVSSNELMYTSGCGNPGKGYWCVFASTLHNRGQITGKQAPLAGTEGVHILIKYNPSTKKYDQTVSINGKAVSTLSTSSGKANGFYMQTECQGSHKGVVNAHSYVNTTIILEKPEPGWGLRPTRIINATADKAVTADAGKTWFFKSINIKQSLAPNDYKSN
ncbi:hypothetical protein BT63DRAFT_455913 [Microthyrium microscopicum]|uniref:Concanavalin A-like lectin/glucanase n=1 Tax=Microthyrium microscopicum TaxID=703497 RepID=A0A6A6UA04_9PEZI|nr:hypothetical protein BT63DRAFT_455913 [Microthyrium microscopicum]